MPNFSSIHLEMAEIYRKDRQTDIVKYRGNLQPLKIFFLLQTRPIPSRESSCQISAQSVKKWLRYRLFRVCVGGGVVASDALPSSA